MTYNVQRESGRNSRTRGTGNTPYIRNIAEIDDLRRAIEGSGIRMLKLG